MIARAHRTILDRGGIGILERDAFACAHLSRSSLLFSRVIQISGDSASDHHTLAVGTGATMLADLCSHSVDRRGLVCGASDTVRRGGGAPLGCGWRSRDQRGCGMDRDGAAREAWTKPMHRLEGGARPGLARGIAVHGRNTRILGKAR